jgi:hypothetical protein
MKNRNEDSRLFDILQEFVKLFYKTINGIEWAYFILMNLNY